MIENEAEPSPLRRLAPAVLVRGMAEVDAAAAAAAEAGRPLSLLSARGAGAFAGTLAWQALVRVARATHGKLIAADILDCAEAPGFALEALRLGQMLLVLDARTAGFADVQARAAVRGAVVLGRRPDCVDARALVAGDPRARAAFRALAG